MFNQMKNKPETPKVGVGVIIVKKDINVSKVLLGKRINSHGAGQWSVPGGHLEIGETFKECCAREVYEETGIKVRNSFFMSVTNDIMEDEGLHYVTIFFRGIMEEPNDIARLTEPDKFEEWRWISFDEMSSFELFPPLKKLLHKNLAMTMMR